MFGIFEKNWTIPNYFHETNKLLKKSHEILLDKNKNGFLRTVQGVMLIIEAIAIRIFELIKYLFSTLAESCFGLIGMRPFDAIRSAFDFPGTISAFMTPFELFGRAIGAIFTPKALEGAYLPINFYCPFKRTPMNWI